MRFNRVYTRGDTKIAINKSGLIRLSSGFCRSTKITDLKYVVLFYDSKNKAIAFKFTNLKEDGVLKTTLDRTGATISATAFMKANNLMLRSYFGRYDWKKLVILDIGEVYIIELGKK